jgi:ankyrin repeat protein
MQKYPSGTRYRHPFPSRLGICTSLPYGILKAEGRNCLNACNKNWLKELAKEIPEAKWEINYIHVDPPTPLHLAL